jgi:hypothetical protein
LTAPAHGENWYFDCAAKRVLGERDKLNLPQMQPKAIDRKYQSKRQFARQMPAQDADAVTTNASHDGGLLNSP